MGPWTPTLLLLGAGALGIIGGCQTDRTAPLPPPPPPPPGTHSGYYVVQSPYGTSTGSGTTDDPWDLATALKGGNGNHVQPGDTIWIRGGTYVGRFQTSLNGQPAAPIVFRQYPGERAIIDGSLNAQGSHLWFWGFEIMQSNPLSTVAYVLEANTVNGKLINLVLHDAGYSGVSMAANKGAGVELYGSLIYNNGSRENIDHGIYAHNATTGTKYITDNVFFNNYAKGIHIFENSGLTRDFQVVGNVAFNNGTISSPSTACNLLISAPATMSGMVATDNLLYFSPGETGIQLRLGNYDTSDSARYNKEIDVENNYAAGGTVGLEMPYQWAQATVKNNVFVGDGTTDVVRTGGPFVAAYSWTGNTYYRDPDAKAWEQDGSGYAFTDWKTATGLGGSDFATAAGPVDTRVFVRPNQYEAGRAFIVVYNFAHLSSVSIDLTSLVPSGYRYDIRNVQALFGAPIASGVYSAAAVAVSMGGVTPPEPIGRSVPRLAPKTGPEFDVFLLTSTPP